MHHGWGFFFQPNSVSTSILEQTRTCGNEIVIPKMLLFCFPFVSLYKSNPHVFTCIRQTHTHTIEIIPYIYLDDISTFYQLHISLEIWEDLPIFLNYEWGLRFSVIEAIVALFPLITNQNLMTSPTSSSAGSSAILCG